MPGLHKPKRREKGCGRPGKPCRRESWSLRNQLVTCNWSDGKLVYRNKVCTDKRFAV